MTEKEHYVPQFYLNGFIDKYGKISAYNCVEKKFLSVSPKNICVKKHLYETEWVQANESLGKFVFENEIERIFSQYEGEFATLLKRIKSICHSSQNKCALILSTEEKELLCRLLCNLMLRNPLNMEAMNIENVPTEIEENEFIKSVYLIFESMGLGSAKSLVVAAQKKAMLTEEYGGGCVTELLNEVKKLNFTFFYANELEFITSDMPVCFGYDNYIKQENKTCCFFVLTPNVAVLFGNYGDSRCFNNRMIFLDAEKVDFFNSQTVVNRKEKHFLIARSQKAIKRYIGRN